MASPCHFERSEAESRNLTDKARLTNSRNTKGAAIVIATPSRFMLAEG